MPIASRPSSLTSILSSVEIRTVQIGISCSSETLDEAQQHQKLHSHIDHDSNLPSEYFSMCQSYYGAKQRAVMEMQEMRWLHTYLCKTMAKGLAWHHLLHFITLISHRAKFWIQSFLSCFISPISFIADTFGVGIQQYADDTQLYISLSATDMHAQLVFMRDSICYSAYMPWQFRLSVCPTVCLSVRHTGGSVKNGWS